MLIKVYEKSKRAESCRDIIAASPLVMKFSEIIILPIPTTRDGVHISGSSELLSEVMSTLGEGSLAVGYAIPEDVRLDAEGRGALVLDVGLVGDFLGENAELTAMGALGIILTSLASAPSDVKFGIVGLGRIGRSLLDKLLFLGARVRVYTTRSAVRRELGSLGIESEICSAECRLSDIDVLINTAPSPLLRENRELAAVPRIIELASGENFGSVPTERYPGIPARLYPESAGRLIAESVLSYISSHGGKNAI